MSAFSLIGSTGSIGTQTLDVAKEHRHLLTLSGMSAGQNIALLSEQLRDFKPKAVSVKTEADALSLKAKLKSQGPEIYWGEEGNAVIATLPDIDKVLISSTGYYGINPSFQALKAKKDLALATKEVLVAAGSIIMSLAKTNRCRILPVDSEHSAIFQCLEGRSISEVRRIFLTCSGGPFLGYKTSQLKNVNVKQALNHPRWKMGQKITIDSATLMNKGFEVIEAHWLFGIPFEKIKVIVHPQSIIHSAVEFVDGTIIAQMGPADMRLPIQYALFYPEKRQPNHFKKFSFDDFPNMTFAHPDKKTFRSLDLAYTVGKIGGSLPAVLNAANDLVVEAFLGGRITFTQIPEIIETVLEKHKPITQPTIEEIFEVDAWARRLSMDLLTKI